MSDGIAPAIDKVGEPEPKAPEAQANAPTMHTTAPAPTSEATKPDDTKPEDTKPEDTKPEEKQSQEQEPKEKIPEEPKLEEKKPEVSAKLGHMLPKPVEIISVPQTPLNNQTPAGGTPRPELKIDEEPKEAPKEEAEVILGKLENSLVDNKDKESSDKPAEPETNGASENTEVKDAPTSENLGVSAKRKLDEEPAAAPAAATNSDVTEGEKNDSDERVEKKARVEDGPVPASVQPATNGKVGRPKKNKKAAPNVGRTARKTRSQGPVEALGV